MASSPFCLLSYLVKEKATQNYYLGQFHFMFWVVISFNLTRFWVLTAVVCPEVVETSSGDLVKKVTFMSHSILHDNGEA